MATIDQIKNYIKLVYPVAVAQAKDRGLLDHLAKVCLIQGALESGYGTASIMVKYNALFGVKATNEDISKGEYYTANTVEYDRTLGKYVNVVAKFRSFKSIDDNIKYYYDLITNKRYGACKYSKDVKEALTIIWSSGYATAPDYVSKCLNVEKILDKYMSTNCNYIVNTQHDPLNVRQLPNGNIIGSIPKGSEIYAEDEWYYVPQYGGFVNVKYLKRKEV